MFRTSNWAWFFQLRVKSKVFSSGFFSNRIISVQENNSIKFLEDFEEERGEAKKKASLISEAFNYVGVTFLSASAFVSGALYRISRTPSVLTFAPALLANEYAHVVAMFQLGVVSGVIIFFRKVLRESKLAKLMLGLNILTFGLQLSSVREALQSLEVYKRALADKGVSTKLLEDQSTVKNVRGGITAMLLSLLTLGRGMLPNSVISEQHSYGNLQELDPALKELNDNTTKTIKTISTICGRGRRPQWFAVDIIRRENISENNPSTASSPLLPVLMYVHGGGWAVGDKMFALRPTLEYLASTQNVVVVSINYRLAPESAFPAQLIDTKRALIWVKENISKWGGDPHKIAVAGESAGGHLSAMMALTANDPRFQPDEHPDADTSVQLCIDIYGVHDFSKDDREHTDKHRLKQIHLLCENVVMQASIRDNEALYNAASPTWIVKSMTEKAKANPADAVTVPPIMMIHGDKDSLASLNETRRFHERLEEFRACSSDVKDVFVEIPGGHHGFGYLKTPRSISTALAIASFMHHHFGNVMTGKL